MIADIASGRISIQYGFHGPNYTTTSACASSTNAIADAFNLIRLGKANVMVTGGAEAAISLVDLVVLMLCTRSLPATTIPHAQAVPSAQAATVL